MRHYKVYISNGVVYIDAERIEIERVMFHDTPERILFMNDKTIIAEFYVNNIFGWVEVIE
ncbi:MAG: hypothetical protein IKN54_00775 [Lachnospiraceae bacterium]|nr:hypothetical protein [Lachnospiraceae bacterium]